MLVVSFVGGENLAAGFNGLTLQIIGFSSRCENTVSYLVLFVEAILAMCRLLLLIAFNFLIACLLPVCRTVRILETCLYQSAHACSGCEFIVFFTINCL